jgi:hypothetical protein
MDRLAPPALQLVKWSKGAKRGSGILSEQPVIRGAIDKTIGLHQIALNWIYLS